MDQSSPDTTRSGPPSLGQRVARHPWSAYLCLSISFCGLIAGLDADGQVRGVIAGSVFDLPIGQLALISVAFCLGMLFIKACLSDPDPPVAAGYRASVLRAAKLLAFIAVVQVVSSICYTAIHQARQTAETVLIESEQQWKTYSIGDSPFTVSVPAHWIAADSTPNTAGTGILMGDDTKRLCLNAFASPKPPGQSGTLEELAQATSQSFSSSPDTTISEFQYETINSFRVATATSNSIIDGIECQYLLRVIDGDSHWLELHVWSTPQGMQSYAQTFEQILGSVAAQ